METNHLYDPPDDLNHYEVQMIAQALTTRIAADIASYRSLYEMMVESGDYDDQTMAEVTKREMAAVHNLYRVMCRFVRTPFEWSFYERMIDRP